MIAKTRVRARVIDDEWRDRATDDVSICGFEWQSISRFQTKAGVIEDGARSPRFLCHPRDQCNAHAGRAPKHAQSRVNCFEAVDALNVIGKLGIHHGTPHLFFVMHTR